MLKIICIIFALTCLAILIQSKKERLAGILFLTYFLIWIGMLYGVGIPYDFLVSNLLILALFLILINSKRYYLMIPLVLLRGSQILHLPGKFIILYTVVSIFFVIVVYMAVAGKYKRYNAYLYALVSGAFLVEFLSYYIQ